MTWDSKIASAVTKQHLESPQLGDLFQEHLSVYFLVASVNPITIAEYHPPCCIPIDTPTKTISFNTPEEFKKYFSYRTRKGSWVCYHVTIEIKKKKDNIIDWPACSEPEQGCALIHMRRNIIGF